MDAVTGPYSRLALLSAILLSAPLGQVVCAQTQLPPDLISPSVPHDVPSGSSANITQLAIIAWQEFTALNWPAVDPASTDKRGLPDASADFLTIKADKDGNYPLLVWQTYRHKNELFPADGKTDQNFNSTAPSYKYNTFGVPLQPAAPSDTMSNFNNLDESSQIGLCNMFAHSPSVGQGLRILYEAKVNRSVFDYANTNGLTDPGSDFSYKTLTNARKKTIGNLPEYGGICLSPSSPDPSIISLPCGDTAMTGDAGEGAIEIKAAWRPLTAQEADSGRFYKRQVLFYSGIQYQNEKYNNAVYGLVALHIIHKTKAFPTFIFATWEQVDNYNDEQHQNTEELSFVNDGTKLPSIPVKRDHSIHSQIGPVNDAVHAAFKAKDPDTVWQYYKLIGVQGMPVNGPPPDPTASVDDFSYYYLANIVVETNQTLQNFFGQVNSQGVTTKFNNVYLKGKPGSPFQMGGCQGCHGTQGQAIGGDMSRLIGAAPLNSTHAPESKDMEPAENLKSYVERSAGIAAAVGYR
jgi:hypothetical protein